MHDVVVAVAGETEEGSYVRCFSDVSMEDVGIVGGKNASLGEMYTKLSQKVGFPRIRVFSSCLSPIRLLSGFVTTQADPRPIHRVCGSPTASPPRPKPTAIFSSAPSAPTREAHLYTVHSLSHTTPACVCILAGSTS
jgi:hypothetical protein